MERLQNAVKRAAQIKEESWDKTNCVYRITLREAADIATEEIGFDTRGTLPVYLLLEHSWNDILDWAELK